MPEQRPSTPRDEAALGVLRGWVRDNFGISFALEQEGLFAERVQHVCRDLHLTVSALGERVARGDHQAILRVADAMSTSYTFFFREPEILEYFVRVAVPTFSASYPLRIWSAAAASGEEAYSVAIALCDALGGTEAAQRVRILGTDISDRMVRTAEAGVYAADQATRLAPMQVKNWFRARPDGRLEVSDTIKRMCTFRRLNLASQPWPFEQRFHVILLRNVLYYFEPHLRARVLEACVDALEPQGYLITSVTEPMLDGTPNLRLLRPAVYRHEAT